MSPALGSADEALGPPRSPRPLPGTSVPPRHSESPTRQYLRRWHHEADFQLRGDVGEGLRSQTEHPEAATEAAYLSALARSATASKTLPAPRWHRTELHPPVRSWKYQEQFQGEDVGEPVLMLMQRNPACAGNSEYHPSGGAPGAALQA